MRLQVLPDASGDSLGAFVKATTATGAIVHSDAWSGYASLRKLGYDHRPRSQNAAPLGEQLLPRAHRAVSNFKAWMHGTHRKSSIEHLPAYLDELTFRHNRPRQPARRLPDAVGAQCRPRAGDLPHDHRSRRLRSDGTNPVCTIAHIPPPGRPGSYRHTRIAPSRTAPWRRYIGMASPLRPYCVRVRHLPQWAQEIPETLGAAGIGVVGCPEKFGNTPAEATLSVEAASKSDALIRARIALAAAFIPTERLAFEATRLD